jgi:N-terminal acetyltransferase B complex non-catalytic subunit
MNYDHHGRPKLRKGVDLQLQSAYLEGNWGVVARLAEKRARAQNDQYFEVCLSLSLSQFFPLKDTHM